MLCLFLKSSVALTFFVHCMLLLPAVQQITSYQEITACLESWKPALSPEDESKNNRILVRYSNPNFANDSETVESITFYLLRNNVRFKCDTQLDELQYKRREVAKENFCGSRFCEFYFDNVTTGYYCIQLRIHISDGRRCGIIYSEKLINITNEKETTVFVMVQPSRPLSHKTKTWIVVGTLAVVGVVLAFALEVVYKQRTSRRYTSVPVVERRALCSIESRKLSGEILAREITGRLLLLYAYESQVNFHLIKQFVDLLRETLPNWELIVDQEHLNDICTLGAVRWVEDNLCKVDRVILISSEGSFRQTRLDPNFDAVVGNADVNYVFVVAWNFLLNDPKWRLNYAKVFNIRFECTRPEFTLISVVPDRSFLVPTDYVVLINHILGCNSWADAFCQDLKGTLRSMSTYTLFVDAVERLAREQGLSHGLGSQDFCWVKPGL